MIVIGGYNSSNTCNLARICAGVAARRSTSPIPNLLMSRARYTRFASNVVSRNPSRHEWLS